MSPGPRQPFRWVKPEVYPLFAAVGLGCLASVVIMSHSLFGVSAELSAAALQRHRAEH